MTLINKCKQNIACLYCLGVSSISPRLTQIPCAVIINIYVDGQMNDIFNPRLLRSVGFDMQILHVYSIVLNKPNGWISVG